MIMFLLNLVTGLAFVIGGCFLIMLGGIAISKGWDALRGKRGMRGMSDDALRACIDMRAARVGHAQAALLEAQIEQARRAEGRT